MARTENLWQAWGRSDPYFAVLSTDTYRRRNFAESSEAEFYASGERHLARVLGEAERRLGAVRRGRALDYGCGVARIVLPMARTFQFVVGADIAANMLAIAAQRVRQAGLENVQWVNTREGGELPGGFDFVHTFIVLQHNRPAAARRIVAQLATRLAPGGAAVIHLTYWRQAPLWRKLHCALRFRCRPYDFAVSLLQRRNPWVPTIPMYAHNLSRILFSLSTLGIAEVSLEFVPEHAGFGSANLYFRRPG